MVQQIGINQTSTSSQCLGKYQYKKNLDVNNVHINDALTAQTKSISNHLNFKSNLLNTNVWKRGYFLVVTTSGMLCKVIVVVIFGKFNFTLKWKTQMSILSAQYLYGPFQLTKGFIKFRGQI